MYPPLENHTEFYCPQNPLCLSLYTLYSSCWYSCIFPSCIKSLPNILFLIISKIYAEYSFFQEKKFAFAGPAPAYNKHQVLQMEREALLSPRLTGIVYSFFSIFHKCLESEFHACLALPLMTELTNFTFSLGFVFFQFPCPCDSFRLSQGITFTQHVHAKRDIIISINALTFKLLKTIKPFIQTKCQCVKLTES